jgi:hypothetical protein
MDLLQRIALKINNRHWLQWKHNKLMPNVMKIKISMEKDKKTNRIILTDRIQDIKGCFIIRIMKYWEK